MKKFKDKYIILSVHYAAFEIIMTVILNFETNFLTTERIK